MQCIFITNLFREILILFTIDLVKLELVWVARISSLHLFWSKGVLLLAGNSDSKLIADIHKAKDELASHKPVKKTTDEMHEVQLVSILQVWQCHLLYNRRVLQAYNTKTLHSFLLILLSLSGISVLKCLQKDTACITRSEMFSPWCRNNRAWGGTLFLFKIVLCRKPVISPEMLHYQQA